MAVQDDGAEQGSLFDQSRAKGQVTLRYDRGTILMSKKGGDGIEVPGRWVVSDPRVGVWRAAACRYPDLVEWARGRGLTLRDEVAVWEPVDVETDPDRPLREYQEAALWAWKRVGSRGIVCLPTGSGKTRVAVEAMCRSGVSTLVLVPTKVLLAQWRRVLADRVSGEVGQVGDGLRMVRPVTVATFESAYRHGQRFGNRFGLLVVDEIHHFGGGRRIEALEMCAAPRRLGLSATPPMDEGPLARLGDLVGPVVYSLSVADLTGSFLADFDRVVLPVTLDDAEQIEYDRNWNLFSGTYRVFRAHNPAGTWAEFLDWARATPGGLQAVACWHRSQAIVSLPRAKQELVADLLARHRDGRVLVFTRDNRAAYRISLRHLIPAITCDIRRKERERILDAFRTGAVRALVSSRVLNEGLDVPEADVAVILGGSQGTREYLQRVGRVLRGREGKRAIIYEVVVSGTSESRGLRKRARGLERAPVVPAAEREGSARQ